MALAKVEPDALRANFVEGMSRAAFTVSIVTTDGAAGRHGLTVSAMTSVAADPPSLLVCINDQSRIIRPLQQHGHFAVSVLGNSHVALADRFAGRTEAQDRFSAGTWRRLASGSPAVADAVVIFDCRLQNTAKLGTHFVFFGHVDDVIMHEGAPLIHHRRRYGGPDIGG